MRRRCLSVAKRSLDTGSFQYPIAAESRAATAIGADALFFETHPNPDASPSDGPNMAPLSEFAGMLRRLLRIREAVENLDE